MSVVDELWPALVQIASGWYMLTRLGSCRAWGGVAEGVAVAQDKYGGTAKAKTLFDIVATVLYRAVSRSSEKDGRVWWRPGKLRSVRRSVSVGGEACR